MAVQLDDIATHKVAYTNAAHVALVAGEVWLALSGLVPNVQPRGPPDQSNDVATHQVAHVNGAVVAPIMGDCRLALSGLVSDGQAGHGLRR